MLVVTAEDIDGERSNELRESFDVKSSTTAPEVVNLEVGNPRVYVDIPASIPVSFDVRDSDANAVAAIVQVLRPDGSLLDEDTLDLTPGTTSTPVSTTVEINASIAGRYTLSVRARDADAQLSTANTRTFDVTTPSTTTPRIFGLRLDERPVYRNTPTTITGTVEFQDVDSNLKTLDIRIVRPGQTPVTVATATIVDDEAAGKNSGTIAFSVPLTADTIAWHTLFVSARDDEGQESSELSAGFAVSASPTAPIGRNIRVTPSRLWVGIPTNIAVALDFTDSDANLVALHTVVRSPAGAAILTTRTELAGVLGRTAGAISVSLAPTAEATGDHRLEWWLEDAAGETSVMASEPLDARAPSSTAPTLSGLDTTLPTVQTDIPARISGTID